MNNQEITEYMHSWVANMKAAPSKESSIMGAVIGITVMLAEIAKRLPEHGHADFNSPRFNTYEDAIGWAVKWSLDMSKFSCGYDGADQKWGWRSIG